MSDLHGCYDKYKTMLEVIDFSDEDILYILGDVVDRGPDGIKILLDIAKNKNVILLRGNHDDIAQKILSIIVKKDSSVNEKKFVELIDLWKQDGGELMLQQFNLCTSEDQKVALPILKTTMIFEELEVQGKQFFLAHTVPEKKILRNMESCKIDDFLWGRPEYDKVYFEDKIIVTGHTPTGLIDSTYDGKIYYAHQHIAVDCGVVFGKSLGCLRLDDMQRLQT